MSVTLRVGTSAPGPTTVNPAQNRIHDTRAGGYRGARPAITTPARVVLETLPATVEAAGPSPGTGRRDLAAAELASADGTNQPGRPTSPPHLARDPADRGKDL